jgi:hypothetical protein
MRALHQVGRAVAALGIICLSAPALAEQQSGNAFTYQGRLVVSGVPYTGTCDFQFQLWDALGSGVPPTGGNSVASNGPNAVPVTAGLFTVTLDFGQERFFGEARWLSIAAGCPSGTAKTALSPRQPISAVPYALALPGVHTVPTGDSTAPNVIGGFRSNYVQSGMYGGTIGGGGETAYPNIVTNTLGTIAGGSGNTADSSAFVGGGHGNNAFGNRSMIPGGLSNAASGEQSFAAGTRAKSLHNGVFIWADSNNFDFSSGVSNSFRVRSTGGVRFVTGIDGAGATTWSCLATSGNAWACSSDRNAKENFEEVDGREVLQRLDRLPILKWNAKGADPNVKHLGPMAQDFQSVFGLGDDDKLISTIDLDGVALAALQGAHREIEELKEKNAALEARLAAIECALEGR